MPARLQDGGWCAKIVIVDTSIAIKWFAPEDDSELADKLIGSGLIAPDFLLAELGNVLWKKARIGQMEPDQAHAALGSVSAVVSLLPMISFIPTAFEIALELNRPVYDCIFIAVATAYDDPLVTADVRLLKRLTTSRFAPLVLTLEQAVNHV